MKNTISLRQAACILGILVFTNKVLVLPSLFYEDVGVDGIFILIGLFLIDFLMIPLFFLLKKRFPTESFFNILSQIITKYGAVIIYVLLCGFFLMKALSTYNISLMYLKNQVYFEISEFVFILCFLTIANSLALKGLRSSGRTTEFFYYIMIGLVVFSTFAMCVNFAGVPVMFNTPISKLFTSSFSYIFNFGDTLFLFLIMDKIDVEKGKKRTMYLFVGLNMVLTLILHAVFFSVFKYTGFMHLNAASDLITFSNNFAGVGRIDIVSVIVIMLLNYFQLSFFNIAFDVSFSSVFPKGEKFFSVIVFDLLFLGLLYLLVTDYTKSLAISLNYMPYFAGVLQYLLPVFCYLFAKKKRRRENE